MSESLALNNIPFSNKMIKTKETKKKVSNKLKEKLENAKLNLIYTKLENINIPFEKKYKTVKELVKDLKSKLNNTDFQKLNETIQNIENSLNTMVNELEIGSTNAFTKVMTSDLAKTIVQSLGISLASRTALILAPTLGTKAIVGTAIAGFGLYRVIKNRKEIIKINEINELNNILSEFEITKDNDNILDTRFNEETQKKIIEYLKILNVNFEYTGYLSLRQTIYSLDVEKKKELCDYLKILLKKDIDIDNRIKKAKRKLNVISSSAASISTGATLGLQIANTINGIDPALGAGVANGFFLSNWLKSVTDKEWFTELSKGLGFIGTELLQKIPFIGPAFEKLFAIENLVTFSTIGAAGGLATSVALSIASTIKQLIDNSNNKKEIKRILEIDTQKYGAFDKVEMNIIKQNSHEPSNMTEAIVVDIIYGYLNEENIVLKNTATSLEDLQIEFNKLKGEDRRKAKKLLDNIKYNLDTNPDFIKDLKKAGNIAIGLFTSGIAVLSIYDIIKKGAFLPELSQKLFPENNIHTPITIESYKSPLDLNTDETIIKENQTLYSELYNDEYFTENNSDAKISHGTTYIMENKTPAGFAAGNYISNVGMSQNIAPKWFLNFLDWIAPNKNIPDNIPDVTAINNKIKTLSPEKLYEFYRYFYTIYESGTPTYQAINEVLSYKENLEKVTTFVNSVEMKQNSRNLINNIIQTVATGSIPLATAVEIIDNKNKYDNTDEYIKNKQNNFDK